MIRLARHLILVLPVVALLATGTPARESSADYVPPAAPPAEFQPLYDELSQTLMSFEGQIDAQWDGSVGSGRLAAGLSAANGNKSAGLLSATNWTRITEMLDAFEAMGVELVKIDLHYPVFTPAFHAYLAANPPPLVPGYSYNVDNFIGYPNSFYNKLAAEIRGRGMGMWIEHSTLFGDWSATPPAGYFAEIRALGVTSARARYAQERAAEAVLIASALEPDYYTLVDEPTTQTANFGYFAGGVPILTPDGWRDLAQQMATDIAGAAPGYTSQLGAGSGTWETRVYTELFAALPELDYIDFHLYPLSSNNADYAQNALDWADYVRGVDPAKKLTLGESWLYKASADEVSAGLDHNVIFGRDTYSFWEPLDRQYLGVLFKMMHLKDFEAVMPFWTPYDFAYLTYGDPDLAGLSGIQLVTLAAQEAEPNIASATLTGTGQRFVELLAAAEDADGDGIPDGQDSGDADGDFLADNVEHHCGGKANDGNHRPERLDLPGDDDGDTLVDEPLPPGADAFDCDADGYVGTTEAHAFSDTNARDQDPCGTAAWPVDFVSGGIPDSTDRVTITDFTSFLAPTRRINTSPGDADYGVRWDLAPGAGVFSDVINVSDLTSVITVSPPMFNGVRAFSGATCPWP